jgi:alkyl sulfatase BDS1-like metallo-beta-lactamase superfamily hydrolase
VPTQLLLDSAATRFDPARLGGRKLTIGLTMPERGEQATIELTGTTMLARMTPPTRPDATITGPRRAMLALLFLKLPLAQIEAMGIKVEGDRAALEAWLAALDPLPAGFNIAEP